MARLRAVPEGVHVLTVSELTGEVKSLLEQQYPNVWVEGEISGSARPQSGHLYFNLKDLGSTLQSVLYRSNAIRLRFDPVDGMQVIARGRLSVYPVKGAYQLSVEQLYQKGLGAQDLALRQLTEKLSRAGYFEQGRKKLLPLFPTTLGVITSPTGAAIRDILEVLANRWPLARVIVLPVIVQGLGSAASIAGAIRAVNRFHERGSLRIDTIIVGRGGGNREDLSAFNDQLVADAIFASKVPIVSAVGHEIDVTIADLVADLRALTPSQAAAAVVPDCREVQGGLDTLRRRLWEAVSHRLVLGKQRLQSLGTRRSFKVPLDRLREREAQARRPRCPTRKNRGTTSPPKRREISGPGRKIA